MKEKKERKKSDRIDSRVSEGKVEILDFLAGLDTHLDRGLEWIHTWGKGEPDSSAEKGEDAETPTANVADAENTSAEEVENVAIEQGDETSGDSNDEPVSENEQDALSDNHDSDEVERSDESAPDESETGREETLREYRGKLIDSLRTVEGFRQGFSPLPEDWESMVSVLMSGVAALARGELTTDFLKCILMGVTYDRDIATARMEGELAGRNAVIEEKLVKTSEGDGLPVLTSGSGGGNITPRPASIFDLAYLAR